MTCPASLREKYSTHSHVVSVYAGLTRGCLYQSSGHPRDIKLAHATSGRFAAILSRASMIVTAPVSIEGKKIPSSLFNRNTSPKAIRVTIRPSRDLFTDSFLIHL